MPSLIEIDCAHCGKRAVKDVREYNRSTKKGRPLYCNRSCASSARNDSIKAKEVARTCPCGVKFSTTTKARASEHCSRSCASRYSMNEERREAQRQGGFSQAKNLLSVAEALKQREAWKYTSLREALRDRPHEFEYELGNHVFDLALLDVQVLVEFDGPYHAGAQLDVDAEKDAVALEHGFSVIRRSVPSASVINSSVIEGL